MNQTNRVKQLENGQIWQMTDANLQIEEVGKLLVQYKLFKGTAKRARISLSGKEAVAQYLRKHKAILVR